MLQLKLQYFGHLTHGKRLWCWERLKAGGEGDDRGGDGWMALLTKWTWVWASSGGWWWIGKPGALQSKGSQRVRHDWVTELNWIFHWGFPGGSDGKDSAMWETRVQSLGWEDHLEKGMATHSSILAWRIPWTEESGELLSMGLQRAGHDWANSFTTFQYSIAYIYHIFFICLSVDEHLGCLHVLAIVNSAAMNIGWKIPRTEEPGGVAKSRTWLSWLHFHFSLSSIEEGNGNPLQCSCLENPRDGGVWWAAIYGVAQSRTWLKRLSSSSMNTGVYVSFWIKVLSFPGIGPGLGLLDHTGTLFLVFKEIVTVFSLVAAPSYIPTSTVGGFPFLHTLSSIYYLQTFWWWPFWLVWRGTYSSLQNFFPFYSK